MWGHFDREMDVNKASTLRGGGGGWRAGGKGDCYVCGPFALGACGIRELRITGRNKRHVSLLYGRWRWRRASAMNGEARKGRRFLCRVRVVVVRSCASLFSLWSGFSVCFALFSEQIERQCCFCKYIKT